MLVGVMGGKPVAGSPRSAAMLWKRETRWSRFLVAGRVECGAGVVFLAGPPSWEAMSESEGGDMKPNQEGRKVREKRSCAEQRRVEKCRGGKDRSGSMSNYCDLCFYFYFFYFYF